MSLTEIHDIGTAIHHSLPVLSESFVVNRDELMITLSTPDS